MDSVVLITVIAIVALMMLIALVESLPWSHGRKRLVENVAVAGATMLICVVVEPPPEPEPPPVTDFGGYRPHYQGHGTKTPGGRGGEIRRVHNPAELQAAVVARPGCQNTPATCARVIVFETSGTYDFGGGQLAITSPFLTLAGQTAPDDGVTIVNARFLVDTHDVVVQHLKVRKPPQSLNACSVGDAGDGGPNDHVYNVVLDHITCTWSLEVNNLLVAGPGSHDVAILDSLIGEALWPGALGGIGAGIGYRNTVARTLFTQQWSRQPIWGAPAELAVINSVSYNGTDNSYGYDTLPAFYGDADGEYSSGYTEQTALVNNVLLAGPNSGQVRAILGLSKKAESIKAGAKIFLEGNSGPGITGSSGDGQWVATVCVGSYGTYANAATCGPTSNLRIDAPFAWWLDTKYVVLPTSEVLERVLANAGARPRNRDDADDRMIADVENRTGTHFLSPSSVTLPPLAVTTRACALPANPHEVVDSVGRTRLDQYLEADSICGAQRLEIP